MRRRQARRRTARARRADTALPGIPVSMTADAWRCLGPPTQRPCRRDPRAGKSDKSTIAEGLVHGERQPGNIELLVEAGDLAARADRSAGVDLARGARRVVAPLAVGEAAGWIVLRL